MGSFYEKIIRPILFTQDPESAHDHAIRALQILGSTGPVWKTIARYNQLKNARPVEVFGLSFPNHVGLAAGFDKNGVAWRAATALGFGHVEIGTITHQKQPGNPQPRLFRIPEHSALVNRMGFNNDGAEIVAKNLSRMPSREHRTIPIGINIGKSKVVPLDQATADYLSSFQLLADYADYFTINVSSPNTPGLRELQGRDQLTQLLGALRSANTERARKLGCPSIPMLLKIAPDLSYSQIDDVLQVVTECGLNGVIATNTTIDRPKELSEFKESGGLSGLPLNRKAADIVRFIHKSTAGKLPIIGVGGILDESTAGRIMDAGADLVQIYTGLVYRGPFLAADISRALAWRQRSWL